MARLVWDAQLLAEAFCERRTLAIFDEPLNLATNLALLAAGLALVRMACRHDAGGAPAPALVPDVTARLGGDRPALLPLSMQALIGTVFLMAAASIQLHAHPSPLTQLLDAGAVYLFVLCYVACFLRFMLGWSWRRALALLPLLAAAALAPRFVLAAPWSGLFAMLPAVAACAVFASILARRNDPRWRTLAAAGLSFAIALAFHRADRPLCALLPTGTHFLWHAFSGLTAYLAASVVLDEAMRQAKGSPATSGHIARSAATDSQAG